MRHLLYIKKYAPQRSRIYLENQAEEGNKKLVTVADIIYVNELLKKYKLDKMVSFCIDTCHLFVRKQPSINIARLFDILVESIRIDIVI